MEVEFVVITESIRGKFSNRAVHIRPLPKGTVTFEEALAGIFHTLRMIA